MRKTLPAALLGLMAPALALLPAPAHAASGTIAVEIHAPKIVETGAHTAAEPASNAGGQGRLTVDLTVARTVWLQERPIDGSAGWSTIATYSPGTSPATYLFTAWGSVEYRGTINEPAPAPNTFSTPDRYAFTRTFVDEFSGTGLDPAKWAHRRPGQYNTASGGTCSRNATDAVDVSDGTVKIRSLPDANPVPPAGYTADQLAFCAEHGWYKDAMIGTENLHEQTYGWFAARARMPRYRGAHSAFWQQHVGGYAAPGGEVDIAEYFGVNGGEPLSAAVMHHNLYWNWNGGGMEEVQRTTPVTEVLDTGNGERFWNTYNIYALHWTSSSMEFYVNGQLVETVTDPDFTGAAYDILSNQVRDYEIDNRVHSAEASYVLDVDWVQTWVN